MTAPRYVVLGVAGGRCDWLQAVGQWAHSGAVAVELVKCVSVDEARVRLDAGRRFSALLVDARTPGLDRDLVAAAEDQGCAVIVVGPASIPARVSLEPGFGRAELATALAAHAHPIDQPDAPPTSVGVARDRPPGPRGRLVAVTGPGGTGTSTVAMAAAQALARAGTGRRRGESGGVVLADFRRHPELGLLHDAHEVAPGIQELVDGFRTGRVTGGAVRAMTFNVQARGYDLLLGVRRSRAWTAMPPRACEEAVDGLRLAYGDMVVDVDADFEGEDDAGSIDVEERNALARVTCAAADVILVVGTPGLKGVHSLIRVVTALLGYGVPAARVLPVVNHAPRTARQRAEVSRALSDVLPAWAATAVAGPIFVPHRRIEDAVRVGGRLPSALGDPVAAAATAVAETASDDRRPGTPRRLDVGSIGTWT